MDDPAFKNKYQKYKLRVKMWEKEFRKKHGRIPSKYDIREASQEIRDSYKMYYKLKTSFLEDTLNDVLEDDGFDVLDISEAENLCESINGGPKLPLDISALLTGDTSTIPFSNLKELPTPNAMANVVSLHKNRALKEFEAVEEFKLNESAWGSSVSNKSVGLSNAADEKKQFKSNLNKKLFMPSSSFSKRNPRKSYSRSNSDYALRTSQSSLSTDVDAEQILPDLETILTQKAKEQQDNASIVTTSLLAGEKTKESIKTSVDEGWLSRTEAQNIIATDFTNDKIEQNSSSIRHTNVPSKKPNYGLSNIDLTKILPKKENISEKVHNIQANTQPAVGSVECDFFESEIAQTPTKKDSRYDSDSIVSNSDNECETPGRRRASKRRKMLTTANNEPPVTKPVVVPITDVFEFTSDVETPQLMTQNNAHKDDPDFSIDKHDDCIPKGKKAKTAAKRVKQLKKKPMPKGEKLSAGKRQLRSKKTRDLGAAGNEQEPEEKPLTPDDLKYSLALERGDITCIPRVKLTDLEYADNVAERYINTIAPLKVSAECSKPLTKGPVNEKRALQRKKLEEKITSGKLNENFVRINIQKKTFVRGKKSVNFSKYKKKMWKNQKRIAALTGPDMDMGGCDGGVFTCFTCGQPGHFAQNCKMKGDGLLPLSAQLEQDPSPFPTLEEAEQMASQSAMAVHSRNITKLPASSNMAIFENSGETAKESEKSVSSDSNNEEDAFMDTDDELEGIDLNFEIETAATARTAADVEKRISPIKKYVGHKIPEEFLKKVGLDANSVALSSTQFSGVGALYDLNPDGTVKDVTPEVLEALHMFGHTSFRKGQDRAVMRILSGLSTLVTLSTGSGKSLCYQLPAYLFSRQKKSITLVISPLVSLMEDQVTGVPHFLRAHCLHTNQTPQQRLKILQLISSGEIDILLVSPEAVVAGERSTGFGSILRQLPPIAFACIDEAHCVSQWSHNFRPSYLMICKVLKKNLGVRTVLGLTATATLPTRLSIINHLGITDGERGIISDVPLPPNLVLSVSRDENRDAALLKLLNSKRFESCQSIIIYCTRRDECERIAGFIRTCMQDCKVRAADDGKRKRKRVNWHAEPYHAGMPASRRRTIQNTFMKNELRIVVATIAFGMGINKPDIRAVLHYNMPRNFESYVQEIGRAGRDGLLSHCHLFLDARGGDQFELRRHIYSNSIDRHVIRKLLQRIFVSCACDKNLKESSANFKHDQKRAENLITNSSDFGSTSSEGVTPRRHICQGHEIGFSIEKTVEALDIPEENISTLLCYMELDTRWAINVLSSAYVMAKVISYGGPKYLKHAAKECPPLAMAIAIEIKKNTFKEDTNIIEFSVVDVAAAIGWNSGVVKYQLKNLEWIKVNDHTKRSPINVTFSDLGFRIKAPGDFIPEEIDDALDTLYSRSVTQEQTQLIQLQYVFQGLSSVAYNTCAPCTVENFTQDRSDQLKGIIRNYFQNDYPKDLKLEVNANSISDDEIFNDVIALLNMYPENNFSGRNIARIFHGISSPNYPAVMWGRCKYWRAHSKSDFNRIVHLANAVIVKHRT